MVAGQLKAKVHELPLFAAAAPPQALAGEEPVIKKAFELKQGEMGGPVETSKGIYIIKNKEHKPAVVPPLAEIKTAVEQKAKLAKSVELAQKKAQEAAGQLAAKAQLKTTSTGSFSYNEKGEVPVIGVAPELMEAALKLTPAAPAATSPFKVGNRWYAIRLKQRIEVPKSGFDSTKEQIKQKLLPKKQDEAQEKWIKELREKAQIEINQALVADK
jgi:peptidyl-prolyl cis-trans isomerase D